MGTAQYRYDPLLPEIIAQRIGQQGGLRKRTDKDDVHSGGEFLTEIFPSGIADHGHFVTFAFAPSGHYLRHNAGEIGVHDLSPKRIGWSLADQVYYTDF